MKKRKIGQQQISFFWSINRIGNLSAKIYCQGARPHDQAFSYPGFSSDSAAGPSPVRNT